MTVVGMYIVCVHPDVGDEPFVDVVPDMGPQIDAIMADNAVGTQMSEGSGAPVR